MRSVQQVVHHSGVASQLTDVWEIELVNLDLNDTISVKGGTRLSVPAPYVPLSVGQTQSGMGL